MVKANIGILFFVCIFLFLSCRKEKILTPTENHDNQTDVSDTFDITKKRIPKYVRVNYIQLDSITKISRFRSSIGHDFSDDFESCRSMKHYFVPNGNGTTWDSVKIFCPIDGIIIQLIEEWAGTKISIKSKQHPAFTFSIFHVHRKDSLVVGDSVRAGQLFGTHIGGQTYSDIAVSVQTPTGWKLISYFDVMSDILFYQYQLRGIAHRDSLIISEQARDADTIHCNGGQFLNNGTIPDWILLN